MIMLEGKKAYTMSETATLLNVVYTTIYRSTANGKLPSVIVSGTRYITEDAIKEYSKQQRRNKKDE